MQQAETRDPDELLTIEQTAKLLRISPRSLWSLTSPRGPLKCVRLNSRSTRYRRSDVRELVASRVS